MVDRISNFVGHELKAQLKAAWLNHQSIANNIANINTPDFQGTRIKIDQQPSSSGNSVGLNLTDPNHISLDQIQGENNIRQIPVEELHLDLEMVEMAKNNIFYQTLVEAIGRKGNMRKMTLSE